MPCPLILSLHAITIRARHSTYRLIPHLPLATNKIQDNYARSTTTYTAWEGDQILNRKHHLPNHYLNNFVQTYYSRSQAKLVFKRPKRHLLTRQRPNSHK